jgi:RNA polymerase sigma-70 factor (ECF subfamily)
LSLDAPAAQAVTASHYDVDSLADVARALRRLPPDQQEVIALRFVSGCDLKETAESMKKSVGAVKVLQHRALKALRGMLADPADAGEDP